MSAIAYDRKHPHPAKILRNLNLNGPGSAKETRHVEIALGHSGLVYDAGDALGVCPENPPRLVDDIIAEHSGKDAAFAAEHVQSLRAAKRYLRDVY